MSRFVQIAILMLMAYANSVQCAEPVRGVHFWKGDWEIACDNTRTCRAAGYQSDDNESPVSVLLTRKAGPNQPVAGQLMLGTYDDEGSRRAKPSRLVMRINGKDFGVVVLDTKTATTNLSASQVQAMLTALPGDATIEWVAGKERWVLSDQGAAAVLLKMDDVQGRVGTPGALMRKGKRSEDTALPALPVPVITMPAIAKTRPEDQRPETAKAINEALRANNTDCSDPAADDGGENTLSVSRLSDSKLLVSKICWRAAYNMGEGYWVTNDKPPYQPVLVTTDASDYSDGVIGAGQKGRGLGDCWSTHSWAWDGKQFVEITNSSTGMCKLLAPGGAWSLPTLVTEVRQAPR